MTEDDRAQGRWQGDVTARLRALEESRGNAATMIADLGTRLADLGTRVTKLESKQQIMWSGMAATALIAGGSLFKLWAAGGL